MPVRNMVILPAPSLVLPLGVGRDKSLRLLNDVLPDQKLLITVCQKDPRTEDPTPDDLYTVGTAVQVLKLLQGDEDTRELWIRPLFRIRIDEWLTDEPFFKARVTPLRETVVESTETEALTVNVRNLAIRAITLAPNVPDAAAEYLEHIEGPSELADFLGMNLEIELPEKQLLLEELDVQQRLRTIADRLQHQVEVLELSGKIQDQVKSSIDKSQRQYYLQEQLKAIQKELGQVDDKTVEVEELRSKIADAGMPEAVETECQRELGRMENIPTASPEYNVLRTYLDWMVELPWATATEDHLDVTRA
ncbi:MAG: LON peptidase substrate-binding domain-containing protein, partial [Planctomycetota bacterium]